jgi:putative DNA primase/helicase
MLADKFMIQDVRRVALAAYNNRLCPVPPRPDGSKAPIGDWGRYQRIRPTPRQIETWYGCNTGVGLVCGGISDNLECLEFDEPVVYDSYKDLATAAGLGDLVGRIERGYLEQSPSGGIHWLYKCDEIAGNCKLARRSNGISTVKVLIETRGEGGYIIIAPSYGNVHPSGKPYMLLGGGVNSIVTLTPDERQALWELARTFDLMPKLRAKEGPLLIPTNPGHRPGDHFSNLAAWEDVLLPHGWVKVFQRDYVGYWRRPGKESGVSATTNWQGSDLLYVFSTSTIFEPERGYSKFSAHALLEHGGDFNAAAKSLVKQGYGNPHRNPQKKHHRPRPITSWEVRG